MSGIQLDVEVKDEDTEVEAAARPQIIPAAIPEEAPRQLCGHGRNYQAHPVSLFVTTEIVWRAKILRCCRISNRIR